MINIDKNRWKSLMRDELELYQEEIEDGWHFCWEWDGLLIHPTWGEFKYCSCSGLDKARKTYENINYKKQEEEFLKKIILEEKDLFF